MSDDAEPQRDQPHVAHYAWPPAERPVPDQEELAAETREVARAGYLARWQRLRYALGVVLACVSILGGVFAALSVVDALSERTKGATSLVLSLSPGGETILTLSASQRVVIALAMVLLEALIVCAAGLLFAKGTHGRLWLALTLAALLASGIVVWARASAHGDVLSLFSPMFYACPAIAIAGLAQLLRAHRLRVRWGE